MNYKQIRSSLQRCKGFIEKKDFFSALKLLIKITSQYKYFEKFPLDKKELLEISKQCFISLKDSYFDEDIINYCYLGYGIILRNLGYIEKSLKFFDYILLKYNNKQDKFVCLKEAFIEKANVLSELGRYDEAVMLLENGLSIYPFENNMLNNIANIFELQSKSDIALYYYNLSIDVDDTNGIPYYNKGRIMYKKGWYSEAIIQFKEALKRYDKKDRRIIDVYFYLGDSFIKLKQYHEAEKVFKSVIDLFPNSKEGYYMLAEFNFLIGRENLSLEYIDKAIRLSKNNPDYLFRKAEFLNYFLRIEDAKKILQQLINLDNENIDYLNLYAELLVDTGYYKEAIDIYEKILSITRDFNIDENQDIIDFYRIALCYFNIEDFTLSLKYINRFIHHHKNVPEAYILRAKINCVTRYDKLALEDLKYVFYLTEGNFSLSYNDLYYFEIIAHTEEFKKLVEVICDE